jgi:hypothetical protein
MGNGALPNGPSYRAHPRLYQICRCGVGQSMSALPGISDIDLFGYRKGIIYLDELHGP